MNTRNLAFFSLLVGPFAMAQEKPNILWITIEDTSPHFIGCYGNSDARTPVIDQLAREGVRFTNAFSTGTICSPSRSALITGVKTYKTGAGNHRSFYPVPGFIKGFPFYLQKEGYYTSNNSKTDYNVAHEGAFTREAWNESSTQAGWWKRQPGQPFFAVFNFMEPHQSKTMTQPYAVYKANTLDKLAENERIQDGDFNMPPFYRDTPEMRKQFARVYNAIKLTDNRIGELLKRLENDHLKDSTIIFFFADHGEGIPRGKTNGINLGYRVPFVIWFPEMYKHLSPWGTKGIVTDELVDFEDLAPTLISLSGGKVPSHMDGRVLMGGERSKPTDHLVLSSDRSDNGIDMVRSVTDGEYMYSRNFMPFMPEARYIRYMEIGEIKQLMRDDLADDKLNPLQKSLFEKRPPEFLFDIENDPWETKNLVGDPAYKPVLEKMRDRLKNEVLASRDVLFLPEYEIGLISQSRTPYEYRLKNCDFPVKQIFAAASLSGFTGKAVAEKQAKLLRNSNKWLRYWGMLGLRSQPANVIEAFIPEIKKAMDDDYLPVAVIASAIVFQELNDEKAEAKLIGFCADKNMDIALMALNLLLYADNKEPFVETVKKVRENEAASYNVKAACLDFLGSLGLVPNTFDWEF